MKIVFVTKCKKLFGLFKLSVVTVSGAVACKTVLKLRDLIVSCALFTVCIITVSIVNVCELVFVFQSLVLVVITGHVVFSNRIALTSQPVNNVYESHILVAGPIEF